MPVAPLKRSWSFPSISTKIKIWFYQSLLAREDTNHPLEKAKNTVYSRPSLKCDGGGRLLKY
jgi:hypothetical protein